MCDAQKVVKIVLFQYKLLQQQRGTKLGIFVNYIILLQQLSDDVVLCHTLPVFTGLGRCPIVN